MAGKSSIEWTDETWNPIVGCSVVSPGCTHCYAMKMADRLSAMAPKPDGSGNPHLLHYVKTVTRDPAGRGYSWSTPVWTGEVALAREHVLTAPLRWKQPRRIFVNSMGDLFHESVPDDWIDRVFAVMALCPQHTFQVLTKRAARMRDYMARIFGSNDAPRGFVCPPWNGLLNRVERSWMAAAPNYMTSIRPLLLSGLRYRGAFPNGPLDNIWLGVSAERQQEADERIPLLLQTPAAVRFISAEPLLGPIYLSNIKPADRYDVDALTGMDFDQGHPKEHLDWVICGGESGPNARPMHPDWARGLRDQCAAAGVPFFFKQWGAWKNGSDFAFDASVKAVMDDGRCCDPDLQSLSEHDRIHSVACHNPTLMRRVGKRRAGRLLDGIEHNEFPRAGEACRA